MNKGQKMDIMGNFIMPLAVCFIMCNQIVVNRSMLYQRFFKPITLLIFVSCMLYFFICNMFLKAYYWLWIAFFAWLLIISQVVSNRISINATYRYLNCVSLMVISSYCICKCALHYTQFMSWFFTLLLLLNTLLWRPNGTYINSNGQLCFVLGTKTGVTYFQILGCFFLSLYYYFLPQKRKSRAVVCGVIMALSLAVWNILQPISTSIVCFVLFFGLILAVFMKIKIANPILKFGFYGSLALNVGIVFFRIQNYFEKVIVGILGETLTFNNRIFIWATVLNKIADRPIMGHGTETNTYFAPFEGISTINQSTHNHLLYLVFVVGIAGCIYYLILCIMSLIKTRRLGYCSKAIRIIYICFGFMWITEQLKGFEMFIMFVFTAYFIKSAVVKQQGKLTGEIV